MPTNPGHRDLLLILAGEPSPLSVTTLRRRLETDCYPSVLLDLLHELIYMGLVEVSISTLRTGRIVDQFRITPAGRYQLKEDTP